MIFIITSMLSEAKPIIRCKDMRRMAQETRYQIFKCDNAYLIITGVGATKAMMATTYLLTRFQAQKNDFVLSAGISACLSPNFNLEDIRGRIYLARSIYNLPFKRSCYPDLLYKTPFREADLITLATIYRKPDNPDIPGNPGKRYRPDMPDEPGAADDSDGLQETVRDLPVDSGVPLLADMEAAFVMEAAMDFVYAHHVFVFKIISDDGDCETLSKQTVTELVSEHADVLLDFIDNLEEEESSKPASCALAFESLCSFGMYSSSPGVPIIGQKDPETVESALLDRISRNLRLTCYQQNELRQLAERYLLRGKPFDAISAVIPETRVKTKKDGKEQYEQIRRLLTEP